MKGATPWPMAGPRDQGRHAAPAPPPQPARGIVRGPKGPPQPTPPPRTDPGAGEKAAPPPPPPPPAHPPQQGSHRRGPPPPQGRGGAPPSGGTAAQCGQRRLGLLPRTHTGVPEQRARRSRKEAAPHMTLP